MKMKRIINILISTALLAIVASCNEPLVIEPVAVNDDIILDFSSAETKAGEELQTQKESWLNHVDVMIFDYDDAASAPGALVYHQRIVLNNDRQSTLSAKRSDFGKDKNYYVQVVANSTLPASTYSGLSDHSSLKSVIQEDHDLHLTGLDVASVPEYFLMEGVAVTGASAPAPVILNDGNSAANTELTVNLVRAAAKIFIEIAAGEDITFSSSLEGSDGGLYYVRNLPYKTYVLDYRDYTYAKDWLETTNETNSDYFTWNPSADSKKVTLVVYSYEHNWHEAQQLYDTEPCIIVNLPLIYKDKNTNEAFLHPNSWYKIPMSESDQLQRNKYYEVKVTINRAGATTMTEPVQVDELKYNVQDWTDVTISVGGESDRPKYLTLSHDAIEIHNADKNENTLEFASSSPISSVTVKNAYYINKFGQETSVSNTILSQMGGYANVASSISGGFTVVSPNPINNAVRYFTLVITNADGITKEVAVTQYPLEYITNQQGWYSYRSDFYAHDLSPDAPTRYDYRGDSYVSASWDTDDNEWSYSSYNDGESGYFFRSKVAVLSNNNRYAGKSDLYYYSWRNVPSYAATANANRDYKKASDDNDPGNARMYHVQIKATSSSYTLGIPKRDPVTDYTLSDEDNAKLVSPSFMIASQLGATSSTTSTSSTYIERAKSHCSQYVETYFDDANNNKVWDSGETVVHLDDWRLPTEAEIAIIVKFQDSSEVMDVVLAGANYFCASPKGYVSTGIESGSSKYTRCIRDVY